MIVQWCCKGVPDLDAERARHILTGGAGLTCRLWQENDPLPYPDAAARLTEHHLDLHVNHYDEADPSGGGLVKDLTPFISLSAGCVDRDVLLRTNILHPAQRTALDFATGGESEEGWLFTCYVLVGVNRAAEIPAVAEEVRNLNHQRRYSDFYVEGEVAAKINVPSRQILAAELWALEGGRLLQRGGYVNLDFIDPLALTDLRQMI